MDIEFPGFGALVVAGERFETDIVIEAGLVRRRLKRPSRRYRDQFGHTPLSPDEAIPWGTKLLVIGTGAYGRLPVMVEVRDLAEELGVRLVATPTENACALLRSMDDEEINAILHVTC